MITGTQIPKPFNQKVTDRLNKAKRIIQCGTLSETEIDAVLDGLAIWFANEYKCDILAEKFRTWNDVDWKLK
jgi:hypothetical protein